MKNVVIEHGPPGHKGVTSIMGIGDSDIEPIDNDVNLAKVGGGAVALWLAGSLAGSNTLKNMAFGAGLAVAAVKYLSSPKRQKPLVVKSVDDYYTSEY